MLCLFAIGEALEGRDGIPLAAAEGEAEEAEEAAWLRDMGPCRGGRRSRREVEGCGADKTVRQRSATQGSFEPARYLAFKS